MLSHWYDPAGGVTAGPGTIAPALRDRGHDVHVVTGFPNYPNGNVFPGHKVRPYQREILDGVTVHRSAVYPSHDTRRVHRAASYLSFGLSGDINATLRLPRVDAGFVYSTPATAAIPAVVLRVLRGVPHVVQSQNMWPQPVTWSRLLEDSSGGPTERILHRFCDDVYKRATTISVTSPGMRTLVEERGVDPLKIEFVPNWANEACFAPTTVTPRLVDEFGPFRPFTVMYAASFGEMQARHNVIDSAALLSDDKSIGFFLIGGGVQLISLKDVPLFRRSKLQANMAAGCRIIGAMAGDTASVISSSGAGFVSAPEDSIGLAESIRRMYRLSA